MKTKMIGQFSLTIIIIIIVMMVNGILFTPEINYRDIETVEDYVQFREVTAQNMHFENFASTVFFILIVILYTLLYRFCKLKNPDWASIGVVFLPPFAGLVFLFSSLQHYVVPQLVKMYHQPEYQQALAMLFSQFLPGAENHAAGIGNVCLLFLGITSLIFGSIISGEQKYLKIAGYCLAVSGFGFIIEYFGFMIPVGVTTVFAYISLLGMVITLVLLSIIFLRVKSRAEIENGLNNG